MYYFKHRQARVLGNDVSSLKDLDPDFNSTACVFFGINRPWVNADSELLAAMGKEPLISIYQGFGRVYRELVYDAISYGEYDHRLTKQENRERFYRLTEAIAERALAAEKDGGIILQLTYGGVMADVLTVREHLLEDLYIQGDLRNHGFGTLLIQNGLSHAGQGAYLDVPVNHAVLIHICEKLGLSANDGAEAGFIRYIWEVKE